jgi:ABC-type Zn uptake system ZnuABC Zn-binding protein ZnuA
MKYLIYFLLILIQFSFAAEKINVVTTLSTYANIAKYVGKDKIIVNYIVPGNQDPHFVRPKPSYAVLLNKADLFISTGLDLELWAPTLVDMSKNNNIRSGQPGYVAAYSGIDLLDKPNVLSRSEGGLHIYGNPHITTSPLNFKIIAENIVIGLEKKDPKNSSFYRNNLKEFQTKIDSAVFGKPLLKLMGAKLLTKLANQGQLIDFLNKKNYKGKKLITYLDGWLKTGLIFRNKKVVGYHKNWIYFQRLFGLQFIDYVEPKPGIPPSPKHIENLIKEMQKNSVKVLFSANYFSKNKVKEICDKVGAIAVMVPMGVENNSATNDVFKLTDYWVNSLKEAFLKVNN